MNSIIRWVDEYCVGETQHERTRWHGNVARPECWQCMSMMGNPHMHNLGRMSKGGAEHDLRRIFRKAFVTHVPTQLCQYVTLHYQPANQHYALRVRPGSGQSWFGMCISSSPDSSKVLAAVMGDMARMKKKADRREYSREQQRAYRAAEETA